MFREPECARSRIPAASWLDRTSLRLAHLFDHFVGLQEQRRRHPDPERLGGL